MFRKLQQRWGLGTGRIILVLITFATGGSLCGYAARKLMLLMDVPKGVGWWALYLLLVTVLWPFAILLISMPLGQFSFFKGYLIRMAKRMGFAKKEDPARIKAKASEPSDTAA